MVFFKFLCRHGTTHQPFLIAVTTYYHKEFHRINYHILLTYQAWQHVISSIRSMTFQRVQQRDSLLTDIDEIPNNSVLSCGL